MYNDIEGTYSDDPMGYLEGLDKNLTALSRSYQLEYSYQMAACQNLSVLWPAVQIASDDGETPYPVTLLEIYSANELVALDEAGNMVHYTYDCEQGPRGSYDDPPDYVEYVTARKLATA